jgi:hypothetical protein
MVKLGTLKGMTYLGLLSFVGSLKEIKPLGLEMLDMVPTSGLTAGCLISTLTLSYISLTRALS